MDGPQELSLPEIRKYMLENGCKVTNHALVKHFKRFLTHPESQNEARKEFKTYVNILATIKNENNQKYLILRKKYLTECPSEDVVNREVAAAARAETVPASPGGDSVLSEAGEASPLRQPPPYKPPPEVGGVSSPKPAAPPPVTGVTVNKENLDMYRDCVNEFTSVIRRIDPKRLERQPSDDSETNSQPVEQQSEKTESGLQGDGTENSSDNKENIPDFSSSGNAAPSSGGGEKAVDPEIDNEENSMSVKEATRKFNRMASEEEAKVISPPSKKKPEKSVVEEKEVPEVTLAHPKAKEWIVSMAKANYQELAKLANEYPELVKLQDPSTGYTALHWAAKHGNEDVVKLIAGTYKADVNARTNGGYTPLHVAMQFGRANIFALLCNTYKANRDLMDWAGNKALDYSKQQTSVSASTYSKIKAKRKPAGEKDSGFLRIGSLNVRVKRTTEAFSNFLGVGNGNTMPPSTGAVAMASASASASASLPRHQYHRRHHYPHHLHHAGTMRNQHPMHPMTTTKKALATPNTMSALAMTTMPTKKKNVPSPMSSEPGSRASVPISNSKFEMLPKSWGSADNISLNDNSANVDTMIMMPPPTHLKGVKKRNRNTNRSSVTSNATDSPRDSISSSNSSSNLNSGYSSMPTTPHQARAPIGLNVTDRIVDSDSDSACGFGSNWSVNDEHRRPQQLRNFMN